MNAVRDYVRALKRDSTRTAEDKAFLLAQAMRLLREFQGASASELNRLRSALELLEVGRDRALPWADRGPALDRGARILQSLDLIRRRHRGKTVPPKRRSEGEIFSAPRPLPETAQGAETGAGAYPDSADGDEDALGEDVDGLTAIESGDGAA